MAQERAKRTRAKSDFVHLMRSDDQFAALAREQVPSAIGEDACEIVSMFVQNSFLPATELIVAALAYRYKVIDQDGFRAFIERFNHQMEDFTRLAVDAARLVHEVDRYPAREAGRSSGVKAKDALK